jgi:hypothetical protein
MNVLVKGKPDVGVGRVGNRLRLQAGDQVGEVDLFEPALGSKPLSGKYNSNVTEMLRENPWGG